MEEELLKLLEEERSKIFIYWFTKKGLYPKVLEINNTDDLIKNSKKIIGKEIMDICKCDNDVEVWLK